MSQLPEAYCSGHGLRTQRWIDRWTRPPNEELPIWSAPIGQRQQIYGVMPALVELSGIEPLTSSLRTMRSPN
jgi:hypothetical protein